MKITKNKNGSFNITELTLGKVLAICNGLDTADRLNNGLTVLQEEVRHSLKKAIGDKN